MSDDRTLTADRLRELLDYDPATGVFHRRHSGGGHRAGELAGCVNTKGYVQINVEGKIRYAHRLAWLYVYGDWPHGQIDHRNEVKDDNRMSNLRVATNSQNHQNRQHPQRNNRSGLLGVSRCPSGRWAAYIAADERTIYLGMFDTPEQASDAYRAAKRDLHPFWNRTTA